MDSTLAPLSSLDLLKRQLRAQWLMNEVVFASYEATDPARLALLSCAFERAERERRAAASEFWTR